MLKAPPGSDIAFRNYSSLKQRLFIFVHICSLPAGSGRNVYLWVWSCFYGSTVRLSPLVKTLPPFRKMVSFSRESQLIRI